MAALILLKSLRSFDLEESTYLLDMYLAIKLREFLIFLAFKVKCLIDL